MSWNSGSEIVDVNFIATELVTVTVEVDAASLSIGNVVLTGLVCGKFLLSTSPSLDLCPSKVTVNLVSAFVQLAQGWNNLHISVTSQQAVRL